MDALIHAFEIDADGRAKAVAPPAPDYHPPEGHYLWLHFDALNPATRAWMTSDTDVDTVATRNLLADDSRPRTIAHDDALMMNLRGVNLNPGSEPEDMIGIRFFIQNDRVLSVERRPLKATGDMAERMNKQIAPTTPGGFLAIFALTITDRMNPTISELNEGVDMLEEQVDSAKGLTDTAALSELRREAILLRRYLAPQRDALNTLSLQNVDWIRDDDRVRIREAADQATRVNEELEAIRERCAIVKDQLTDQRAEDMNRNMMLLSVVAAIFLPLGLISGMMGINVGGMPWTDDANGFWYVTAVVVIIGVIQLLIFRLLKWL